MSMFDRQGIPEDLIREDKSEMEFEDAVALLLNFSLVTANIEG